MCNQWAWLWLTFVFPVSHPQWMLLEKIFVNLHITPAVTLQLLLMHYLQLITDLIKEIIFRCTSSNWKSTKVVFILINSCVFIQLVIVKQSIHWNCLCLVLNCTWFYIKKRVSIFHVCHVHFHMTDKISMKLLKW